MIFDGGPIPPYELPPVGPGEMPFDCIVLAWMFVAHISLFLPRPWFLALFKIAYPFMPEKLKRDDDR